MPRFRRANSNLGADIRGDTGAPAMATMDTVDSPSHSPEPPATRQQRSSGEKSTKLHSKRRRTRTLLGRCKAMALKHTWLTPFVMLIVILALYALNPTESNPIHSGIFLSYAQPPETPGGPIVYGKGKKDLAFCSFYMIVLSFTREFIMQRVIKPWALYCGIRGKGKISRFMEQVYTAMYFAVFGPFGLYVMKKTDIWYFNTTAIFEHFPHKVHTADFKAYYLLQASYWAQQTIVMVLQLEKPRKDFKELVGHHIITIALIALSYRFHFTHIGLSVYITHDVSDFFLATSKTLNYLDSVFIGPYFAMFVGIWIYLRHYLNLKILWAVLTKFRTVGPFELNWETEQYKCWISQYITFGLLSALQAINLFWLFLILRIAKNYVISDVRADERSDNEEEDEDETPVPENKKADIANGNNETLNGDGPVTRRKASQRASSSNGQTNGRADEKTANGKKKHR